MNRGQPVERADVGCEFEECKAKAKVRLEVHGKLLLLQLFLEMGKK